MGTGTERWNREWPGLVLHPQNGAKIGAALHLILAFPLAAGAWNCLMTVSTSALHHPGLCPAG